MASYIINILRSIAQRRHLAEYVIHLRKTYEGYDALVILEILACDNAAYAVVNIHTCTTTGTEVGVTLVAFSLEYALVVLQTIQY